MTYEDVQALPHIARIDVIGNHIAWRVYTEDGYVINLPAFGENQWKTVTILYPRDDISTIIIRAVSELDEDAVINGGGTTPEVEVSDNNDKYVVD